MPDVTIRIPSLLDRFTDGRREIDVHAETAADALSALIERYPALDPHLFDSRDQLRTHLLLFVDGDQVGQPGQDEPSMEAAESTRLSAGTTVTILQAVSGG